VSFCLINESYRRIKKVGKNVNAIGRNRSSCAVVRRTQRLLMEVRLTDCHPKKFFKKFCDLLDRLFGCRRKSRECVLGNGNPSAEWRVEWDSRCPGHPVTRTLTNRPRKRDPRRPNNPLLMPVMICAQVDRWSSMPGDRSCRACRLHSSPAGVSG
jgi:hypothetical protein